MSVQWLSLPAIPDQRQLIYLDNAKLSVNLVGVFVIESEQIIRGRISEPLATDSALT